MHNTPSSSLPRPALDAVKSFSAIFNDSVAYSGPLGAAWAPGRVNLIGEHTDYNDGFVLPIAVDRVTAFAGRRRPERIVRVWSSHFERFAQFDLDGLPGNFEQQRADLPGWARYILGVIEQLVQAGIRLEGFDAVMGGDVPVGGGMSSSAALEVSTVQACALFSDSAFSIAAASDLGRITEKSAGETGPRIFSPMQVAALCQRAEQIASGVQCGILDQAASCLGLPHKAALLDCRSLDYRYLPFNDPEISLVVIDTSIRRELAASAYNERRRQCEEAAQQLRELILLHEPENRGAREIRALRDITQEQFERYKHYLPEILRKRASYIIAEEARVQQVICLLERGDVEAVGAILWAGHAGLRDEYEVSCLELDTLVEIAQRVPGVLGARMLGGGFGGCTINLVRNEAVQALSVAVMRDYPVRTGRQASIDICQAAGGPGHAMIGE